MAKTIRKSNDSSATLGFEAKLWAAADAPGNNMDAAEYKHIVLGLIFFEVHLRRLRGQTRRARTGDPQDLQQVEAA
jgi:type I restriction enzyme M protein